MSNFRKILLAYDGSPGAQDAANAAADLAKKFDAEVTVLTIGSPLFGGGGTNTVHMTEQDYHKIADEGLSIMSTSEVKSNKVCRWLDPADEILIEATNGSYDLIVMGHRSARSSIRRDAGLLGSVAVKVINRATISVLIVRPPFEVEQ